MRLAGLTIIHPHVQPEFIGQVLTDLASRVDALFVLSNGAPIPEAVAALEGLKTPWSLKCTSVDYDRKSGISDGRTLHEQAFAMLDEAKPEMVLYPDADELLPRHDLLESSIQYMCASHHKCVEFPALVCAEGSPDRIIGTPAIHAQYHGPHVKLCVWRPGIKLDSKHGFNYPGDDYVGNGFCSPWPLRHLYVATPRAWRERWTVKPQPWMRAPWKVVPFDPYRTWDQWMGQK
jgi:hypothetical protein